MWKKTNIKKRAFDLPCLIGFSIISFNNAHSETGPSEFNTELLHDQCPIIWVDWKIVNLMFWSTIKATYDNGQKWKRKEVSREEFSLALE